MQLTAIAKLSPVRRILSNQKLLAMKFTVLLLLTASIQISARTTAQIITIDEKNAGIEKLMSLIERQSGYRFFYDQKLTDKLPAMSLHVKDEKMENVLTALFKDLPISYTIVRKSIVLKAKNERPPLAPIPGIDPGDMSPPPITVHGHITNENGEPIAGVTIAIKGGRPVSVTDNYGEFTLVNIAADAVLVFSAVSIETYQVKIDGRSELAIVATTKTSVLRDIVVSKGYYSTTQRLNTGNVAKITSQEIAKQPVANVLEAMKGRVTGLFITQSSGLPGSDVKVILRGLNSLNAADLNTNFIANVPLYIVDGVPYPGADINIQAASVGNGQLQALSGPNGNGSPLAFINPADIESIEVLKDADATAIYGSRASNGVILITTKQGKVGKTRLEVNVRTGAGVMPKQVPLLNTRQYRALRLQAFANDGIVPTPANAPDLFLYDSTKTNNFQDEWLGKTATYTDAQASLTGGTKIVNFIFSGNYHKENTVYLDRRANNSGGVHLGVVHNSENNKLCISATVTYNVSTVNLPGPTGTNFVYNALTTIPNYPIYDSTGNFYWGPAGYGVNPVAYQKATYHSNSRNLVGAVDLKYSLFKGFNISTRLGYNRIDYTQTSSTPLTAYPPAYISFGFKPFSIFVNSNNQTSSIEPQAEYMAKIAGGTLSVLAGGTYQHMINEQPYYIKAGDFPSDLYLSNAAFAATKTVYTSFNEYKYVSLFGRVNYNWSDKYLINGVFRRDGSSKFGPGNRFGNFASIGAAWLFSNESFIKDHYSWLSFGKLKASYGLVGNDNIGDYGYLSTYIGTRSPYGANAGITPARIANPDYRFEVTRKLEASLDLGFLHDRVVLSTAVYRNRSGNQLIGQPIASQSGFASFQANLPATVENSGVEIGLNTVNIRNKDFEWSSSLNITFNSNKIVAFPGLASSPYASTYIVGKPVSAFYTYQFKGVDALGYPAMIDQNKDGVITADLAVTGKGDLVYGGKTTPDYFGGLSNTLRLKNWQLDIFFQFVQGLKTRISKFVLPGQMNNIPLYILDKINALTPGKTSPLISTSSSMAYRKYLDYVVSDQMVAQDGSYIRLSNVALSYKLSEKYVKAVHMTSASFFVQGQNLFTITKFKGMDPETGFDALPPLRRIVAGIKFSL